MALAGPAFALPGPSLASPGAPRLTAATAAQAAGRRPGSGPSALLSPALTGAGLVVAAARLFGRSACRAAEEEDPASVLDVAPAKGKRAPRRKGSLARRRTASPKGKKRRSPQKVKEEGFNAANELGAGPFGYFDPLGFGKGADYKTFFEYREAEIKHGRVAMMASVGCLVQHYVQLWQVPDSAVLNIKTAKYSMGAWALFIGTGGFLQLSLFIFIIGLFESTLWRPDPRILAPGDYGDPLGLGMYDDDMRNKEINNGRMAMISVMGIFFAEAATGKDAVEQLATLFGGDAPSAPDLSGAASLSVPDLSGAASMLGGAASSVPDLSGAASSLPAMT